MMSQQKRPLLQIGKIVHNAAVFQLRRQSEVAMDQLEMTVVELFKVLDERKISYVLVGGVALLQYIEGRNTEDIDLIMAVSALKQLPEIIISQQDDYFARGQFKELQIDLLLTRNRLFEKVQRNFSTLQRFQEQEIVCATVEGLLLLKLYALPSLYRQANFARVGLYENDVATLVQLYRPTFNPIFAELAQHLSAHDLSSVKEIVAEIEGRIARFENSDKH